MILKHARLPNCQQPERLCLVKRLSLILLPLIAAFSLMAVPSSASVDNISAPTHNETSLSVFSCAATRQGQATGDTVNHSHRIANQSVSGHIDAFDCESHDPVDILEGCVWRTYYIYDNKLDGSDIGIVGPGNQTCWLNN